MTGQCTDGTEWSDPRVERAYQRRVRGRLGGVCPTCDGKATIFPSPENDGRGHIYCDEDECGWIHRDLAGIDRYVDTDTDRPEEGDE